jgi:hypothetical protein
VTVDNRGTADRADDLLIGGATYAVAPDDGDGIFERNEDGPVLFQISDPSGIAVLRNLPPASYWVIETTAPPGYDVAAAVPYRPSGGTSAQSCFDAGTLTCFADPAGGGMTAVFVVNTPLPAISTEDDYRSPAVIILAIVGLVIVIGAVGSAFLRRT